MTAEARRLDVELVRRQLASSRRSAQQRIREGAVTVDGRRVDKPARLVRPGQQIALDGPDAPYVGRAGIKLAAALDDFAIDVTGRRCLDVGSSTGGFSDCLLQRNAAAVVALDVGTGQLHDRLRNDKRVTVRERTDIRSVTAEALGGRFDLVVADLSFISLRLVVGTLASLVVDGGPVVALVKPQFEAGRRAVSRGKGVIVDPGIWREALASVVAVASSHALSPRGATVSPIVGASGNIEFMIWLEAGGPRLTEPQHSAVFDAVVVAGERLRTEDIG